MFSCAARQRAQTARGFTLIELLVVIAIIAILAAILFPVFAKVREKANQNTCLQHQRQLAIQILSFVQDNDETFPLPSEWVEAVNMASDPKLFDCPSNSHRGVPSDPDYGMNAFLFSHDPNTGEITGVPMGEFEDPSRIELTADLKKMSDPGSTDANPVRAQLINEAINPFPRTFTINGFLGNGSGEARHGGAAVVSFADGHAKLLKGRELGGGKTAYSIPRSGWRLFVDFGTCKDAADAQLRLSTYATFGGAQAKTTGAFNTGSKTWDLADGQSIVFNATNYATDANCIGDATGAEDSFMIDCTAGEGSIFGFGLWRTSLYAPFPGTDVDSAQICDGNVFTVNTAADWAQGGALYSYSTEPDYQNYATGEWVALPNPYKGKRYAIATSVPRFVIESDCYYHANLIKPWMDPTKTYWNSYNQDPNGFYAGTYWAGSSRTVFSMPGASPSYIDYNGPVQNVQYNGIYNRFVRVNGGTLKINKILFTSGNSVNMM